MERQDMSLLHEWHVQINRHHDGKMGTPDWNGWMYLAKTMADEVPRMAMLHGMERRGEMAKTHVQCHNKACDNTPQPVPDNHLRCGLGVECRKCPHLLALDGARLTPKQIDEAKAWTCAAHMLRTPDWHDDGEGWLTTVDDRMYWDRVYQNIAGSDHDDEASAIDAPVQQHGGMEFHAAGQQDRGR